MPLYTDQMNRVIEAPLSPKRIISLVPSQTELLFDMGLDNKIIGVTKFCIHPEEKVKQITKIGGTKNLFINMIKYLKPDLIIGNKEENERVQVEELMRYFPVWLSDIANLEGATNMIRSIGSLVGKQSEAEKIIKPICTGFKHLEPAEQPLKVAYLIWRKPYITAGKGTFIDDMLQKCGLVNAFTKERYPEITAEQLIAANPNVILLSSEPYPFKEKHLTEFKDLLPDAVIKLVDGELFSWYGSRLIHAPEYFKNLIKELESAKSQKYM